MNHTTTILLACLVASCSLHPAAPIGTASAQDPRGVELPASTSPALPDVNATLHVRSSRISVGTPPVEVGEPGGVRATPVDLVLRVRNQGARALWIRTGGDDQSWRLTLRGPGVTRERVAAPCLEVAMLGAWETIPPGGVLDVPLRMLVEGERCHEVAYRLTTPGAYSLDVALRAHYRWTDPGTERGDAVQFTARGARLEVVR